MSRKLAFGSGIRIELDFKLNSPDPKWVDKTSSPHGCHLWRKGLDKDGYGRLSSWNPEKEGIHKNENWEVHIAAFLLAHNLEEMPEETPHVLHTCSKDCEKTDEDPKGIKYRRCCNPEHLYAGTPQQNIDDKVREGRQATRDSVNPTGAKGEANGNTRLNWPKVREIRILYATGKWFQWQLGLKFDVSQTLIGRIINNKIWKPEDDPANQSTSQLKEN